MSPFSLHLSTKPFPSSRATSLYKSHTPKPSTCTFTTRTTDPETPTEPETSKPDEDDPFESRLSQVRFRYRSGTGKKAEVRKSKKGSTTAKSWSSMYLPPVPLKEPMSGAVKWISGLARIARESTVELRYWVYRHYWPWSWRRERE